MHILPRGFVRIRHYGILSSTSKIKSLPILRAQMPEQRVPPAVEQRKVEPNRKGQCPDCKTQTLVTVKILPKRGPPLFLRGIDVFENQSIKK